MCDIVTYDIERQAGESQKCGEEDVKIQRSLSLSQKLAQTPQNISTSIAETFLSALSSFLGLPNTQDFDFGVDDIQTFYCTICLENCHTDQVFRAANCGQIHEFCKACIGSYLAVQIKDGVISPTCPGFQTCRCQLLREEIGSLVSSECFAQLERFENVKKLNRYRECPTCSHGHTHPIDAQPEIKCVGCGVVFCFVHNNAHTGIGCDEYARSLSQKTRSNILLNEQTLNRTTRACPGNLQYIHDLHISWS